jgi:hypothetical protein
MKKKINLLVIFLILSISIIGCLPNREPTAPTEIQRPQALLIEPQEGKLIVPINANILLYFSEPMDPNTFNGRFKLYDIDSNFVEGNFIQRDSIIQFVPKTSLKKSTIYYAELRGRVRDVNRNSIIKDNNPVWDNTTLLLKTWFYTEGNYSDGGFYDVYLRDKKEGKIISFKKVDSTVYLVEKLSAPDGFNISSDGKYLVIANTSKNQIQIASTSNGNVVANFDVAQNPVNIKTIENYAYVLSVNGRAISKINLSTLQIEKVINLSFYPGKLEISQDQSKIYTLDQSNRDLVIINSDNGTIIKRVRSAVTNLVVGEIKFNSTKDKLYVCDSKGRKVKVYDENGNFIKDFTTFSTGVEPIDIYFHNNKILVVAGNSVYFFDEATGNKEYQLNYQVPVKSVCLIPTGELIYVVLTSSVQILDNDKKFVLKTINLNSSGINTILVNPIKSN